MPATVADTKQILASKNPLNDEVVGEVDVTPDRRDPGGRHPPPARADVVGGDVGRSKRAKLLAPAAKRFEEEARSSRVSSRSEMGSHHRVAPGAQYIASSIPDDARRDRRGAQAREARERRARLDDLPRSAGRRGVHQPVELPDRDAAPAGHPGARSRATRRCSSRRRRRPCAHRRTRTSSTSSSRPMFSVSCTARTRRARR